MTNFDPIPSPEEQALLDAMPADDRALALRVRSTMWAAIDRGDNDELDRVEALLKGLIGDEPAMEATR